MFSFKSEAIADKRTTIPLRSEEKKARSYFKSDWTCFKANNSVSPIGHRSSQTHVSIENCFSRKRRNGRESRTRFNFYDHPTVCRNLSYLDNWTSTQFNGTLGFNVARKCHLQFQFPRALLTHR